MAFKIEFIRLENACIYMLKDIIFILTYYIYVCVHAFIHLSCVYMCGQAHVMVHIYTSKDNLQESVFSLHSVHSVG